MGRIAVGGHRPASRPSRQRRLSAYARFESEDSCRGGDQRGGRSDRPRGDVHPGIWSAMNRSFIGLRAGGTLKRRKSAPPDFSDLHAARGGRAFGSQRQHPDLGGYFGIRDVGLSYRRNRIPAGGTDRRLWRHRGSGNSRKAIERAWRQLLELFLGNWFDAVGRLRCDRQGRNHGRGAHQSDRGRLASREPKPHARSRGSTR